jgi:hypothetical protein
MFFIIYRLLLVLFQGARGLPLPEEKWDAPILPVRTTAECYPPRGFGVPILPVRTKGSGHYPRPVVVSERRPIYDDEEIKMPKLVRQVCLNPPVGAVVSELKPIYDNQAIILSNGIVVSELRPISDNDYNNNSVADEEVLF